MSEGSQILRIFDAGANNLCKSTEEVCSRSWKPVTVDEPSIFAKTLLDATVVENGQGNGCFPDTTNTNECNGIEAFGKGSDTFDELLASEKGPRGWRRWLSKHTGTNIRQWAYWESDPAYLF